MKMVEIKSPEDIEKMLKEPFGSSEPGPTELELQTQAWLDQKFEDLQKVHGLNYLQAELVMWYARAATALQHFGNKHREGNLLERDAEAPMGLKSIFQVGYLLASGLPGPEEDAEDFTEEQRLCLNATNPMAEEIFVYLMKGYAQAEADAKARKQAEHGPECEPGCEHSQH